MQRVSLYALKLRNVRIKCHLERTKKTAAQPNDDVENQDEHSNSRGTISVQYEAGLSRIYTTETHTYMRFSFRIRMQRTVQFLITKATLQQAIF